MLFLPFINIAIFIFILNSFTKGLDDEIKGRVNNYAYAIAFPTLLALGFCTSSGVYLITTVKDRQDKLRYLLNFTGMKSFSYFLGISAAEACLYVIPTMSFVLLVMILDIQAFTNQTGWFILILLLFGLSFVNLANLIGFMFSDLDKAFRNSSIFMFIIGFLFPFASSLLVLALSSALDMKDASIRIPINWVCLLISPFNCLNNALRNIIYDGFILMAKTPEEKVMMQEFKTTAKEAYGDQELGVCVLIFLGQAFVLFFLCVLLDWRNMNSFKGKDKNKQKVERLQLPQNEDVQ